MNQYMALSATWSDEARDAFGAISGGAKPLLPEERLMVAVLEDAAATLRGEAVPVACRRFECEVRAWVVADDPEWPFSFVNVCAALRLDVGRVRAWMLSLGPTRRRKPHRIELALATRH